MKGEVTLLIGNKGIKKAADQAAPLLLFNDFSPVNTRRIILYLNEINSFC
jgi:hypothetical protein